MAESDAGADSRKPAEKSATAFRTISEVGRELDVPQHVLRFWESKFSQIKPLKRGGGRRYYRPEDIALLKRIRDLLYTEGYTIRGVQRLFRESGVKVVLQTQDGEAEIAGDNRESAQASGLRPETRDELNGILTELISLRRLLETQ